MKLISEKNNKDIIKFRNTEPIAKKLVSKQGKLRKNILGKRVFYIGRSIISGNPNVDL